MIEIHRLEIDNPDKPFRAPKNVTFGWQSARKKFSVWYEAGNNWDAEYVIAGTGHALMAGKLRATVVLPDGFHVYHLIEIGNA